MNYNYLKDNIKEKGFSIEKMAQKVGMTPQGLRASMKNDTLTVHTLEKISYILEVPIYDLMNEQISKKQTGARSNEDYLQQILNKFEFYPNKYCETGKYDGQCQNSYRTPHIPAFFKRCDLIG